MRGRTSLLQHLFSLLIVTAATAVVGCKTTLTDSTNLKIDSGTYVTTQSKNNIPAVFWLGNCTGTAVSHNTLVYAAHCVGGSKVNTTGQVDTQVCIKKNMANPDNPSEGACSTKLFVHPKYSGGSYRYDLAVGVFPDNTFKNYFPLQQRSPTKGDKVLMVGFSSENMTTDDVGAKRWGYNAVSRIDSDAAIVTHYGQTARNVAVSPGDSGGPLFNDCKVIGVASRMGLSGSKTSLHTNLTIRENVSWMQDLVRNENAKMCGLAGADETHCLASQMGTWNPDLKDSNQTQEFPCLPGAGNAPQDENQTIFLKVAKSNTGGVDIYVGTKIPGAQQATVCKGKDMCAGPEVTLPMASANIDITTFGPANWPAQNGQDITVIIKDSQGSVMGSRSLRLIKKN